MFPQLGPMELAVVLMVAVLLFGKRLPEVGRSLGKGIIEFKKGLRGVEDEFEAAASASRREPGLDRRRDLVRTSVPKFEPPSSAPVPQEATEAPHPHD